MRHRKKPRKLSRFRNKDQAIVRNQAVSLILYEKISTTKARAKILQQIVEKLITIAKAQNLTARKRLISYLPKMGAVRKLMEELAVRYKERGGGYTRINRIGQREGDGAPLVQISLI